MAKSLSKTGIASLGTIRPWHVSQSVDALTGTDDYDISISGSLTVTGSILLNGLNTSSQSNILTIDTITGQLYYTASNAIGGVSLSDFNNLENSFNNLTGSFNNLTGSFNDLTGSFNNLTESFNNFTGSFNTSSFSATGSFSGSFNGDFTGSFNGDFTGSFNGEATGSFTGSFNGEATGSFTGSFFGDGSGLTGVYTTVEDEGTPLTSRTTINFVGAGVTATDAGGKTVVTITGASGSLAAVGNNYEIQFNSGSELGATGSFKFNYESQSLEQGLNTTANGIYSHAEGVLTNSSGAYSHTEGGYTLALGLGDHAEGLNTTASSVGWPTGGTAAAAHSEGVNTIAYGIGAHAEGNNTLVSASFGHAEGTNTKVISNGSHAEGYLTTASGDNGLGGYSHAEGYQTFSSGSWSHAEGRNTISKGSWSHAEGRDSISSGSYSHAEGSSSIAIGEASHAEGVSTLASGLYSHAEGLNTTASDSSAHSQGFNTIASGIASFVGGFESTSSGDYSVALGTYSNATRNGSIALGGGVKTDASVLIGVGAYNKTGSDSSYATFVVGGGTNDAARSNLFRVSSSGECLAATTFTNGGADYAEYFESYDGQSIPVGTIVELTGSYIKICETPDNAIGVISNKPNVLGNSDGGTGDEWVDKYEKDVWGNYIMETYEYEIPDGIGENFQPIFKTVTGTRKRLNPNYDPTLTYIPRGQRPEWNVVGLLGQLKILKNQTIPSKWIKMKDINNEIALYLVK